MDESAINTVEPVKSEQAEQTTNIERQLSHIAHAIASFGKQQAVAYETINKKLDFFAIQQANMNDKLNLLAKTIGVDVDVDYETM